MTVALSKKYLARSIAANGIMNHVPSADIANAKKKIDYECEVDSSKIMDRIYACRLRMMQNHPFYSSLALRLDYKEVDWIPTAAVDGKSFLFNKHFINALDDSELLFLMAHEILHLVLKHLTRRNRRDHQLYNAAADYVINYMLVRDKIGKFPEIGGLYDPRFADMYTEQVYTILEKEQQDSGEGPGNNFDVHISIEKGGDSGSGDGGSSSSSDHDVDEDGNVSVSMSEDEIEELEAELTSAIIEAAKVQNMKDAGKMPGEIARLIQEYTEPKIDWRIFLAETANGQVKNNYTRSRPNRRFPMAQYGVAIPTLYSEDHVEFSLAIDTSGSISQTMLQEFVSEVRGIVDTYSSFEVHIWCFDTKIYNYKVFTQDNIEEMDYYEVKGGGGTDFEVNWSFMKEIDHVPTCFCLLTDGYPWKSWGDADYCETVFIIHDQQAISSRVKAPFGMTLYFNDF